MNIGKSIANVLKAVLLIGFIYAFMNWESIRPKNDNAVDYAKQSCVDEIGDRYNASTVNVYMVNKNESGYVVRASITLQRGARAKVYCLTNEHGRVEDILVEEH